LSLLSGGEQALTALALIFAVFLTNPAPLCVLDEVDATLDDANVERLYRLVAEIGETTGTRFLLITASRWRGPTGCTSRSSLPPAGGCGKPHECLSLIFRVAWTPAVPDYPACDVRG
jgi:hypothetical protein